VTASGDQSSASLACDADGVEGRATCELDRGGLIEALVVLLEAERAGARVGMWLIEAADDPESTNLVRIIRRDETQWCRVLVDALRRLGAEPSAKVGDLYEKAMAIAGFEARLAFLNRGQAWVVRGLKDLLPKIRDDRLQADLRAMLEAHVANIELTARALERRAAKRGVSTLSSDGRQP
jgi:hypothetical protein